MEEGLQPPPARFPMTKNAYTEVARTLGKRRDAIEEMMVASEQGHWESPLPCCNWPEFDCYCCRDTMPLISAYTERPRLSMKQFEHLPAPMRPEILGVDLARLQWRRKTITFQSTSLIYVADLATLHLPYAARH